MPCSFVDRCQGFASILVPCFFRVDFDGYSETMIPKGTISIVTAVNTSSYHECKCTGNVLKSYTLRRNVPYKAVVHPILLLDPDSS
jgi:hypothetical protein